MPHVEDGQSPLAVEAETVLREQRIAVKGADAASVVHRLGQRVTGQHRQSLVEPPGELDRQGVVPGLGYVPNLLDFREFGIRLPALHRTDDSGNRLVPIEHALETIAMGAK